VICDFGLQLFEQEQVAHGRLLIQTGDEKWFDSDRSRDVSFWINR